MKLEDRLSNDLRRSVERFAPRARTVEELMPSLSLHAPSGRRRVSLTVVGLAIGFTPRRGARAPFLPAMPPRPAVSPVASSASTASGWSLSYAGAWRAQLQPNTCPGATHQVTRAIIVTNTIFIFRPYSPGSPPTALRLHSNQSCRSR